MKRYLPLPMDPVTVRLHGIPKGYPGTRETIKHIRKLICEGAKDFYVRQKAIDILLEQGVAAKDYLREIQTLFHWVQKNIRYTRDPFRVEVLHSARRMLELRAGDCDDMTILLGSMLKSIGHPIRLVLAGFDRSLPEFFSHIYLEASHGGRWISLDATMPYAMGWTPPAVYRQVFFIEKESTMFGENDELQGIDGFGQAFASPNPVLWEFVRRMWRAGLQPRDPQIRSLWRQLRRQRRLGRRSPLRQFLRGVWQRGVQPRDPQVRQFAQQLREWGMVPPRPYTPGGVQPGLPNWYMQPPSWYTQPPTWYQSGSQPGFPMMPFRPPFPGLPGAGIPRASFPQRALQTLTSAVTSPFRAVTNLFR